MMASPRLWALACVSLLFPFRVTSQQTVKIDDANVYNIANPNGVQFGSKGWSTVNPENLDRRYDGTYTWSQEAGANLIFLFRGMFVALRELRIPKEFVQEPVSHTTPTRVLTADPSAYRSMEIHIPTPLGRTLET